MKRAMIPITFAYLLVMAAVLTFPGLTRFNTAEEVERVGSMVVAAVRKIRRLDGIRQPG